MDLLTQGLLGAAAAHAVFGDRLGRRALGVGALAGLLPDADVLIRSASDPLLAPIVHRGATHALVAAPIVGALAAAPWLLRRSPQTDAVPLFSAATIGALTHGMLDACTSYGTQLLWPFSSARFGWDVVAIVDPVVTLALLIGVAVAFARRSVFASRVAVGIVIAYLALGALQLERAAAALHSLAEMRGHAVERAEVFPTLGNQLVWRGLYQSGDTLYADRLRVTYISDAAYVEGYAVPLATTPATHDAERFAWLAADWIAWDPADPTLLGDARYSLRSDTYAPVWGIRLLPRTAWVDRSRERSRSAATLRAQLTGRAPDLRAIPSD